MKSSPRRYKVLGLPYRRTQDELADSPFLLCLRNDQVRSLGAWLRTALTGAQWETSWVNEDLETFTITVERVS
jgi:hypothetical protein